MKQLVRLARTHADLEKIIKDSDTVLCGRINQSHIALVHAWSELLDSLHHVQPGLCSALLRARNAPEEFTMQTVMSIIPSTIEEKIRDQHDALDSALEIYKDIIREKAGFDAACIIMCKKNVS